MELMGIACVATSLTRREAKTTNTYRTSKTVLTNREVSHNTGDSWRFSSIRFEKLAAHANSHQQGGVASKCRPVRRNENAP